ncbi:MAG: BolA family transcriptional regulator [Myxococcales bacterium]|nr:BolA family transcriptional regulator [Myxococcales bacterium]
MASLGTIDSSITETISKAIADAIEGAEVSVGGGGGRFTIEVCAAAFEGKSMVQSQRLVYSAISHLMAGDGAPVHAVDSLITKTPGQ